MPSTEEMYRALLVDYREQAVRLHCAQERIRFLEEKRGVDLSAAKVMELVQAQCDLFQTGMFAALMAEGAPLLAAGTNLEKELEEARAAVAAQEAACAALRKECAEEATAAEKWRAERAELGAEVSRLKKSQQQLVSRVQGFERAALRAESAELKALRETLATERRLSAHELSESQRRAERAERHLDGLKRSLSLVRTERSVTEGALSGVQGQYALHADRIRELVVGKAGAVSIALKTVEMLAVHFPSESEERQLLEKAGAQLLRVKKEAIERTSRPEHPLSEFLGAFSAFVPFVMTVFGEGSPVRIALAEAEELAAGTPAAPACATAREAWDAAKADLERLLPLAARAQRNAKSSSS